MGLSGSGRIEMAEKSPGISIPVKFPPFDSLRSLMVFDHHRETNRRSPPLCSTPAEGFVTLRRDFSTGSHPNVSLAPPPQNQQQTTKN
jgi:hypothetical protein